MRGVDGKDGMRGESSEGGKEDGREGGKEGEREGGTSVSNASIRRPRSRSCS